MRLLTLLLLGTALASPTPTSPPVGVQSASGEYVGRVPLNCELACAAHLDSFYACYLSPKPQDPVVLNECNRDFCRQDSFTHYVDCLSCVAVNGDDREIFEIGGNVKMEGEEWLRGLMRRCGQEGIILNEKGLSMAATTTGPYITSYTSGQTISWGIWTGVSQYTSAIAAVTSITTEDKGRGRGGGGSGGGGSTGAAQARAVVPALVRRLYMLFIS